MRYARLGMALLLAGLLCLCGCAEPERYLSRNTLELSPFGEIELNADVLVAVKDYPVERGAESLTLEYGNIGKVIYHFDETPHLEIRFGSDENAGWYVIDWMPETAYPMETFDLSCGGSVERTLPLEELYGRLPPGHYRYVATIYGPDATGESFISFPVAAEFEVE